MLILCSQCKFVLTKSNSTMELRLLSNNMLKLGIYISALPYISLIVIGIEFYLNLMYKSAALHIHVVCAIALCVLAALR